MRYPRDFLEKGDDAMFDDAAFMKNDSKWPNWPVLPVKSKNSRWGSDNYLGVMVAEAGPVVYLMDMYDFKDAIKAGTPRSDIPKKEFASFEAVAEEYMVD